MNFRCSNCASLIGLKRKNTNKSDCNISFGAKKLSEISNGLPQSVTNEVVEPHHDPRILTPEEEDEIKVAKFHRLQAQHRLLQAQKRRLQAQNPPQTRKIITNKSRDKEEVPWLKPRVIVRPKKEIKQKYISIRNCLS